MEFEQDSEITPHSHDAQSGVVLNGEMRITIDEKDLYYIRGGSS
ncbi:MAG: hypothetical protein N4A37_12190 [Prolixibacteraceae bacterium]|jgi:quercetin dioxygenase-like cupin family protein|nr:hypothetical protein [Prolixibacteraceae bacterium]